MRLSSCIVGKQEIMKRFASQLLAVISLLIATGGLASSAMRPGYGGTLRISLQEAPISLDPTSSHARNFPAVQCLQQLLFDNLVPIDDTGRIQPGLASSWQSDPAYRRWTFILRQGVHFSDSTILTAELVAASLRKSNPEWNVSVAGDSVIVQLAAPEWSLPAMLALPRNAILDRSNSEPRGTGPYRVTQWHAGRNLVLTARDDYWGGRAFIDSVLVQFGVSVRDQTAALDLGKTDLVDLPAEVARSFTSQGKSILTSPPVELIAIVLTHDTNSADDAKLMEALGLSLD